MTTDTHPDDWWDGPSDGRPEVRIWLEPTETGTSILVSTDHQGRQALDTFWQPGDQEGGDR
jgi:hypothetical protein